MTRAAFAPLLLPDERLLWSAESQPLPKRWFRAALALGAGLLAALVLSGDLWTALRASLEMGSLFPLHFLLAGGLLRVMGPAVVVGLCVWFGLAALRPARRLRYGLTSGRAFIASPDDRNAWVAVSTLSNAGTLVLTRSQGLVTLVIPVEPAGEDDQSVEFAALRQEDAAAALTLLDAVRSRP